MLVIKNREFKTWEHIAKILFWKLSSVLVGGMQVVFNDFWVVNVERSFVLTQAVIILCLVFSGQRLPTCIAMALLSVFFPFMTLRFFMSLWILQRWGLYKKKMRNNRVSSCPLGPNYLVSPFPAKVFPISWSQFIWQVLLFTLPFPRASGSMCGSCSEDGTFRQYVHTASSRRVCDSSGYWTPEEAVGKVPWLLISTTVAFEKESKGKGWSNGMAGNGWYCVHVHVCVCWCVCCWKSLALERLPGASVSQMSHMCLMWRPHSCEEAEISR